MFDLLRIKNDLSMKHLCALVNVVGRHLDASNQVCCLVFWLYGFIIHMCLSFMWTSHLCGVTSIASVHVHMRYVKLSVRSHQSFSWGTCDVRHVHVHFVLTVLLAHGTKTMKNRKMYRCYIFIVLWPKFGVNKCHSALRLCFLRKGP
jgi:hypothetical protein